MRVALAVIASACLLASVFGTSSNAAGMADADSEFEGFVASDETTASSAVGKSNLEVRDTFKLIFPC